MQLLNILLNVIFDYFKLFLAILSLAILGYFIIFDFFCYCIIGYS
jgi:hypothetical protein